MASAARLPLKLCVPSAIILSCPFFIPIVSSLVLRGIYLESCQWADKIWSSSWFGQGHSEQLASCKNNNYDNCLWERISLIKSVYELRFKEAIWLKKHLHENNGVKAIAPELWPSEAKGLQISLAEMTVDGLNPGTMWCTLLLVSYRYIAFSSLWLLPLVALAIGERRWREGYFKISWLYWWRRQGRLWWYRQEFEAAF